MSLQDNQEPNVQTDQVVDREQHQLELHPQEQHLLAERLGTRLVPIKLQE